MADESQLGGLSSLLSSLPTTAENTEMQSSASLAVPKPPKKRYLQQMEDNSPRILKSDDEVSYIHPKLDSCCLDLEGTTILRKIVLQ